MTGQMDQIKQKHFIIFYIFFGWGWGGNLEGEFGFALRLPPNDESQQEAHSEDQAEGCDVPHCSASLHGQYTERQDEGP